MVLLRKRIITFLRANPLSSNVQIAKGLDVKASYVSSTTCKMVRDKQIKVATYAMGPRGGKLFTVIK